MCVTIFLFANNSVLKLFQTSMDKTFEEFDDTDYDALNSETFGPMDTPGKNIFSFVIFLILDILVLSI